MHPEFERVAIVNRGEAAMRFINAVREFNQERGTRIRTIALYTDPDRRAMFVREADEAFGLGPATVTDPRDGERNVELPRLRAARGGPGGLEGRRGLDGLGLRRPSTPTSRSSCERLGIVFIGPPPDAMRRLSDKISAKRLAEDARVPVVPWSGRAVVGAAEAASAAEALGYPVLVKAAAGGGGRGIRLVTRPEEMPEAFESARHESLRAFGDATVFVEKLLQGVRHVEVQVLADAYGTMWAVGVRDCTVQRRHQKVLEESPAPTASGRRGPRPARRGAPDRADRRVPQRRDRRVPLRPEERHVRVPRGQHAPAGRAHGHRGDDRPRPREAPDPRRPRRAPRGRPAGLPRATPSRCGSTPRTPTPASRPRPAPSSTSASRPDRASGSTAA